MISLEYDADGVAAQAAKLIRERVQFTVSIRGRAKDEFDRHLVAGELTDLPMLGLTPALQPLLGILAFAIGKDIATSFVHHADVVELLVGDA